MSQHGRFSMVSVGLASLQHDRQCNVNRTCLEYNFCIQSFAGGMFLVRVVTASLVPAYKSWKSATNVGYVTGNEIRSCNSGISCRTTKFCDASHASKTATARGHGLLRLKQYKVMWPREPLSLETENFSALYKRFVLSDKITAFNMLKGFAHGKPVWVKNDTDSVISERRLVQGSIPMTDFFGGLIVSYCLQ